MKIGQPALPGRAGGKDLPPELGLMSSGKVPLHLWPLYGAHTQYLYRPALQKQRVELARHPLACEVLARRQPAQEGERARGWVDG